MKRACIAGVLLADPPASVLNRLGETRALDWRDVKWDASRIVVERAYWRVVLSSTKEMGMTTRLQASLSKYRATAGPVLPGRGAGGAMTNDQPYAPRLRSN
jgi:integrase